MPAFAAALAVAVSVVLVVPTVQARSAFRDVQRVNLDPTPAVGVVDQLHQATDDAGEAGTEDASEIALPDTLLLVGTDNRDGLEDDANFGSFEGQRADVLVLAFSSDEGITLLSLPRDLAVTDTCDGGTHKIAEALQPCSGQHALSHLVSEVESVVSVDIDHVAAIDMAGFQRAVEVAGGYEICVEHPVRDRKSGLDLDSGCTDADGVTTVAWLRSRSTQQLVDGRWQTVPGTSDLARNERQRQFLIDMLGDLGERSGVGELLALGGEIAPYLTIDDGLSIVDMAQWGWRLRNTVVSTVSIDVADARLSNGAAVLQPTEDIAAKVKAILNGGDGSAFVAR
jgi:LCP family protein required for cell wall assembly